MSEPTKDTKAKPTDLNTQKHHKTFKESISTFIDSTKKTVGNLTKKLPKLNSQNNINMESKEDNNDETLYKGQKKFKFIKGKNLIYNVGNVKRKTKRVLVTGGAGFLGSHLVDKLMNKGYDVICVDNLFSGSKHNVYEWFGHPHFEFMRHDVCNPLYVEVDEIYHLACPASPVFYQDNPIKTIKTCFMGTMHMLGLAKRINARILFTSTSEVYGDPKVHPQTEEYWGHVNPIGIRSCYDEGKRISETLMFEYKRMHNVDIAVARIFNTYGPRMLENDGRVVSNFICQALKNEEITIYGDGSQTRSFCYVDDQIDGLIKLMESKQTGPINIGNPNEYTIKQLAQTIVSIANNKYNKANSKLAYKPLPSDDPKKRKPDITKAKNYLNWQPNIQLKQGIDATMKYFYEHLVQQGSIPEIKIDDTITNQNDNSNNDIDNDNAFPKVGGLKDVDINSDEVKLCVDTVKSKIDDSIDADNVVIIGAKSQVVAGKNYFIRIESNGIYMDLRIFVGLDKSIELIDKKTVNKDDNIEYF